MSSKHGGQVESLDPTYTYISCIPNKRIKFAPLGRPTRNGEAPLLAAQQRRWAVTSCR
jgi:hypothetical protein